MSTALMQCRMFSPLASSCFQTGLTVYWGAGLCICSALHKMCNKSLFTLLNRLSCLKKSSSCFVLFSVCEKGESRVDSWTTGQSLFEKRQSFICSSGSQLDNQFQTQFRSVEAHCTHDFLAQLDTLAVWFNFTRAIVSCYHGV